MQAKTLRSSDKHKIRCRSFSRSYIGTDFMLKQFATFSRSTSFGWIHPHRQSLSYNSILCLRWHSSFFLGFLFQVDINYPWPSSTSTFNCHGYAWHMSWLGELNEFDDPYMMTDSEAASYFNDPSYKECTKAEADVWWINNGTHSALATSTTDELKSKWGTGPLATHDKDNQPNTITSVTYYKRCYYKLSQTFTSDETKEYCKVEFYNTILSSNVDIEISFEDWILIEGTFSTGTGATLEIYPE